MENLLNILNNTYIHVFVSNVIHVVVSNVIMSVLIVFLYKSEVQNRILSKYVLQTRNYLIKNKNEYFIHSIIKNINKV